MTIDTVYWEITGACNMSCKHCYLGGASKYKRLSEAESLDRVIFFAENGIKTLLLMGGEPLLNPSLFSIIKKARSYDIDTAVLTNGTLINKENAIKLAEADTSTVQISIDGIGQVHESIRGKGSFSKIEEAIGNLSEVGLKPLMKFTINKDNLNDMYNVIWYCKANSLRLNLSLTQDLGNANVNSLMPSPEEYFMLFTGLYKLKKKENLSLTMPDFSLEEYLETGVPISGCSAGQRMAVITKDDYFLPCPFMSGQGLTEEHGVKKFGSDSFYEPGAIFDLIRSRNSNKFGCPLREFKVGKDLYSVYEFARYLENEAV